MIKPTDKTAYGKWPIFVVVLSDSYIRLIYHRTIFALSGKIAVISSSYILTVKLMANPSHSVGTGNQFLTGYNHSATKHGICSHYVTSPD